jgi:lipoprotein-anchoring transpeptidase ErfK/SrfK
MAPRVAYAWIAMRTGIVHGAGRWLRVKRRAHLARWLVCAGLLGLSSSDGVHAAERRPGEPDLVLRDSWSRAESFARSHDVVVPRTRYALRQAFDRLTIYWSPRRGTERRGWIAEGSVFEVGRQVEGPGCEGPWARLRGGGYVCLDATEPSDARAPRLPAAHPGSALPFTYAARAGAPAFSYAFTEVRRDESGREVLVRPGGRELDASRYDLHDRSSFRGRDLRRDPVPEGMLPAWVYVEDAPVHPVPSASSKPAGVLPKHTAITIAAEPADEEGRWFRVPDGLGPGRPGFVDGHDAIRRWAPAPLVRGVGSHEIWLDIDLDQQILAVRRGEAVIYVTMVSTGVPTRPTPTGIYRIRDKRAWSSMGSRPTSDDRYFVEYVPWTMYFRDFYAIHGAYWHDVFGQQRSHGCINLAPHDAAYVYRVVSPRSDRGVMWTYASSKAPGSTVRIRKGLRVGGDFRD